MPSFSSKLPCRKPWLSANSCMEAFRLFDKDDTGLLEYEELKAVFETIFQTEVDISEFEGQSFTAAKFRDVVQTLDLAEPQRKVASVIMKYIKENREATDEDDHAMTTKSLEKVFKAYDKDDTGALERSEVKKLFKFLGVPIGTRRFTALDLFGEMEGALGFDDFCTLARGIDEKCPELNIDDKINEIAGNAVREVPSLDDVTVEEDDPVGDEPEDEPPNKKALLVGINYLGTRSELGGCINDVRNQMAALTEHFGFSEENILLLTEDQDDDSKLPTAQNIRDGLAWLIDGAGEGDYLFFAYSGHGSQVRCKDGTEPDGKTEILCPQDLHEDWDANSITDDYLFDVFYNQVPEGVRCLCLYDCCHSGTISDLSCTRDLIPPGEREVTRRFLEPNDEIKAAIEAAAGEAAANGVTKRGQVDAGAFENKAIWVISGCQDAQESADATLEGQRQGAMTWALLGSLTEGNSKGPWCYKYEELLTSMRKKLAAEGFEQVPALSTTADRLFQRSYLSKQEPE
eukprot:TRINITY_DN22337_c0_g1_i4.p1 TRINITY_DN22337_c0_g1~~TRINITY_DN22337_c0_g1_i4.p1  ORF type:complete len:539 (-),score=116.46 TRINITY_DN22337_c0_g1_i4:370-1917(-)